jgi:hypothetical protein
MKFVKTFENFTDVVTIKFRDHKSSKEESFETEKEYTKDELKKHLEDLYPGNRGFIITKYGNEYMVKVKIDDKFYPAGFCDSKFTEDDI